MRLRIDQNFLGVDHRKVQMNPVPIRVGEWITIRLKLDCSKQMYDLFMNDNLKIKEIAFQHESRNLERLVFRTGPYRNFVDQQVIDGRPSCGGMLTEDMPGSEEKVALCVYWIDDVKTKGW